MVESKARFADRLEDLITKSRAERSSAIPQCSNKSCGTEIANSDIVSIPIFLSRVIIRGCNSRPSKLVMAAFWDNTWYRSLFGIYNEGSQVRPY